MNRRLLGFVLLATLLGGCGLLSNIPVDPSAFPGQPLILTFDGRGNPPVVLLINGVDVAHLPCLEGETKAFAPGAAGVPNLPWHLEVIRESDRKILLDEEVTSMPKWLLAFPDSVGMGVDPASGPPPPTCGPG